MSKSSLTKENLDAWFYEETGIRLTTLLMLMKKKLPTLVHECNLTQELVTKWFKNRDLFLAKKAQCTTSEFKQYLLRVLTNLVIDLHRNKTREKILQKMLEWKNKNRHQQDANERMNLKDLEKRIMQILTPKELELWDFYLDSGKDYAMMTEVFGYTYSTARKKISTLKGKLKSTLNK